jgi:CPA2 family monovalent cation:H+ antiporter-2
MPHETALIGTVAAGLGLAFIFGLIASRLRLPPILGYLVAGVAVGPFTPGYVADAGLAAQLAEIGVILLMFGVGLHFSIRDLFEVRRIAIPGAMAQITVATVLGAVISRLWGLPWGAGLVFGLSLSVASTVVLLRALEDRGILESSDGRIAVGWLIVEDIVTVLALVVLPVIAVPLGGHAPAAAADAAHAVAAADQSLGRVLIITAIKLVGFVVVMMVVGRRMVPLLLKGVVNTGSRELFTLAVLAIALGLSTGAAYLFDVSFALGAFFAGIIVSESDFSHEAATNALPLQDAFAVLFFVSVGMLFDPAVVIERPLQLAAVLAIIVIGKSLASFAIVLLFRYPLHTALIISASLAQIGEFSFILATMAVSLGIMTQDLQNLLIASALLSITLNPAAFAFIPTFERFLDKQAGSRPSVADRIQRPAGDLAQLPAGVTEESLRDHVVLIGYGRVGGPVARELIRHHIPFVVVEQSRERAEALREQGLPVIYGDATRPEVLSPAHLEDARMVIVAAPDAFQARAIVRLVRDVNPGVRLIVRTHSDQEREFLESSGADVALVGERELAVSMTRHALRAYGAAFDMAQVAERTLRRT